MSNSKVITLSFSGCGFLGLFHVGALSFIRQRINNGHISVGHVCGASAGALVATALLLDIPEDLLKNKFREMVIDARSRNFGPLNPAFDVNQFFGTELQQVLPEDAHIRLADRLTVSLTTTRKKNVLISKFESKEDLIEALVCSCFLPVFSSNKLPSFRGTPYLDGGISNNQPVFDSKTIKISPFAGASHVCPKDQIDGRGFPKAVISAMSATSRFLGSQEMELSGSNLKRLVNTILPSQDFEKLFTDGFERTQAYFLSEEIERCFYTENEVLNLFQSKLLTSEDINSSSNAKDHDKDTENSRA